MTKLEEHHQEVESWVKSGEVQGLSFPCPLDACGTAWPKARPLLRACSSPWRSKLLPCAQPKWLQMAKEISPRKKVQLCQLHCHGLTSTQAWESNTRVLLPLTAPPFLSTGPSTVPTPQGRQAETAPAGYNTHLYWNLTLWCLWCIISFFSPPNPNSYTSQMWHYQPIPKWVSVGTMVLCDSPFLAPPFLPALSLHLPRKRPQEWPIQGAHTAMKLQPLNASWALLWLSLFSKQVCFPC